MHQQRASILREPRESSDTGLDSIYNMYADSGRSSWLSSADHGAQVRPSGDRSSNSTLSQTVTLSSRPAPHEPSALPYHVDEKPQKAQLQPLKMGLSVENSPRVSLATTSSTQAQSSYATPLSTYRYSDLFESGINCPTSDASSSSYTTPAIPDSKEFADGPLCSPHIQYSLRGLPPLPPSRQSTPSPSRNAPLLTPQRSLLLNASKPSSKISLSPSDGEDLDGFHVRSTYAQLEASGVKGDGYEEGVERTRARIGKNTLSQLQADSSLHDGSDKKRDLHLEEIQVLQSIDRSAPFLIYSQQSSQIFFFQLAMVSSQTHPTTD
jgi:hypothetical protein